MNSLTVGVVASPRRWRSELQSHVNNHVAGMRLRLLREPRAAAEDHLDVLVVDDVTSFLTRNLLRVLRQQNVRVLGVYDPDAEDGFGKRYLEELGVDATLPADVSAEDLVATIESFASSLAEDDGLSELLSSTFGEDGDGTRASVTVVAGPAGGPGVTEVAVALAAALAGSGAATVLVEVDEVAPSLAPRLLYDLEPNVLTALHDVHHGTATLDGVFGARMPGAPDVPFAAVPGLAVVADWPLVRGDELAVLIDELATQFVHVIVAAGPVLEDLGGNGPERFGATRAALLCADALVGVCSPNPVGVLRILEWWADTLQLVPDTPVSIVVNRAPSSPFRRAQLERELRDNVGHGLVGHICFVPEDGRVALAAWDGSLVTAGPFTRSIQELARHLFPARARSRRRWMRRTAG